MSDIDLDQLATHFRLFAERECQGSSPLYQRLANGMADDGDLLALAAHAQPRQPVPNLLFAGVHYLLLSGIDHELQQYYASLTSAPKDHSSAFPQFKGFCNTHRDQLLHLLQTRRTQTNEVRRCAYLYPAFCRIYQRLSQPLALLEIGTAAGLNLLWDQYAYVYNDGEIVGKKDSAVQITSTINGHNRPSLNTDPPPVTDRIGVDINLVDLADEDQQRWLRALIWPEHTARVQTMASAVETLKANPPRLIQGDGIDMLKELSAEVSAEAILCVYHTHVANQFSPREKKETLLDIIDDIAQRRAVCHIYNNMMDGFLHLDMLGVPEPSRETIADTDGHARWFEWMVETDS